MKFIDSNVLVYFADGRNPKKQSMARAILVNAMGNQQYVISHQVLNDGQVYCGVKAVNPFSA